MHAEWKAPLAVIASVVAVAAIGITAWFVWFSGPDTDDIEGWTKREVATYMRTNAKLSPYRLDVQSVDLIHANGNEYNGFVTVETRRGAEHKVPITVTYDGDQEQGMWEIERGGMLFLMDEPAANSSP